LENARFYSELEARVKERTAELVLSNQALEEAYAKLKTMQEELIQAEKMNAVGQLASGMAHEVRNPLAILLQSVNYLEAKVSVTDKKIFEIFQMIKSSVKRADEIIAGLVDFSRAGALNIVSGDINSIVEESLILIQHQVKFENISVVKELADDLPKVWADRSKMVQVFVNLFLNAIQAMPNGGKLYLRTYLAQHKASEANPGGEAEANPKRKKEIIIVEIEDTGIGIPEENLKKVIDPFFTTKGPRGGAGLGLSVSKHIIDMHQGIMEVKSAPGKGTCIILSLRSADKAL
ncbi:MAG: ATP-binding protein, partial [Candidatus Omnitrophica bacterium]|nr:ATP-binding protein [Candidatus Omnitrophota bacterium]